MPFPGGSVNVKIKCAYEQPVKEDGMRILVDRLWPRGLTKEKAAIDIWLKEIGPSTELRKWFGHDPKLWTKFREKYLAELKGRGDLIDVIKEAAHRGPVTLIYAARDEKHNEALVLKQMLEKF